MLAGLVEEEAYSGAVHLIEIDITEDPEIAEAAGVTGTPTVHIFHRKERLAVMAGVRQKREYRTVMDEALDARVAQEAR
jgi:thioredoxin reductase (NADPH)